MKYFYLLFLVGLTFVFFNSSSSGPAAVQGRDRTGSPVANGNCSNCHFGGNFGTSVIAQLLKDSVESSDHMSHWYIAGECRMDNQTRKILQNESIHHYYDLPKTLVQQVIKTKLPIALDDARDSYQPFYDDRAGQDNKCCTCQ